LSQKNEATIRELLASLDYRTFDERVVRLSRLGTYTINIASKPVPNLMGVYQKEASHSYVNGNYRSCIFSCSAIVDQVFRHEILQTHDDIDSVLNSIKCLSFGQIIGKAREEETPRLRFLLKDASWLNDARNKIAVHPICLIDRTLDEQVANKRIALFIEQVINLVPEDIKKEILSKRIQYSGEAPITIEEILSDPTTNRATKFLIWSPHHEILDYVALEAYLKMVKILTSLFPE